MSYRFRATKLWAFSLLDDYSFLNWVWTCLLRYSVLFFRKPKLCWKEGSWKIIFSLKMNRISHLNIYIENQIHTIWWWYSVYDSKLHSFLNHNFKVISASDICWSTLWQTKNKTKKLAQQNCTNQANPLMILFKIYNFHSSVSRWFFTFHGAFYTPSSMEKSNKKKQNKKKNRQQTDNHSSVSCLLYLYEMFDMKWGSNTNYNYILCNLLL